MHLIRLSVVLVVGLMACTRAQVATSPAPTPVAGSHIRYALRSDSTEFVTGRMISLSPDSLVVERLLSDGPARGRVTMSISTDSISRLQVLIGQRHNGKRGALLGALVGGGIGVLCAAEPGPFVTSGQCLVGYTLIGAGTGLLIGTLSVSDLWAPTALPSHRPEPAPLTAGRFAVGIRFPIR